jgi:hypothetical protein
MPRGSRMTSSLAVTVIAAPTGCVDEDCKALPATLSLLRNSASVAAFFPPGKRNAIDADFPVECVGIEKPECADSLYVSGLRQSFPFDEVIRIVAGE